MLEVKVERRIGHNSREVRIVVVLFVGMIHDDQLTAEGEFLLVYMVL